jgi:hypothetical protein
MFDLILGRAHSAIERHWRFRLHLRPPIECAKNPRQQEGNDEEENNRSRADPHERIR